MDYGSKEVGGSKLKKKKNYKKYICCVEQSVSRVWMSTVLAAALDGCLFFVVVFFLILKPSIKPSVQVT